MASRLWGLTRRQTLVAFAAAIAVGIVIAIVTTRSDPEPSSTSEPGGVAQVEAGRHGSRHAVWVFGFQTLRFDRRLRHAQHLPFPGFGAVQGTDGRVYMYDAGTGRVGVVVNSRNTRTVLGEISGGRAQDDTFAPVIAVRPSELWIGAAPGEVTRFDLRTRRADAPIRVVDTATPGATATTAVASTADAVVAVTLDGTDLTLTRVDPATRALTVIRHVSLTAGSTLDGVAIDGAHLWIVADASAFDVDATTLSVAR